MDGNTLSWLLIGFSINAVLSFIPAAIAKSKGSSFWKMYLIGVMLGWLLTILLMLILPSKMFPEANIKQTNIE